MTRTTIFTQRIMERYKHQRGMVLMSGLLFLLLITMISLTAMNANSLQKEMSDNYRLGIQALMNAESGIRDSIALLSATETAEIRFDHWLSQRTIATLADVENEIFYTVYAMDNDDDADPYSDSDNVIILSSVGTVGSAHRMVNVRIAAKTSEIKVLSWLEVID